MCSSLKPVKIPTARCTECRYLCRVKALLQSVHNPAFTSSHALHVNPSTQDALLPTSQPGRLSSKRLAAGWLLPPPLKGEGKVRSEASSFDRELLNPDYGRDIHARAHRVMPKTNNTQRPTKPATRQSHNDRATTERRKAQFRHKP